MRTSAAALTVLFACSEEAPVSECRSELYKDLARMVCPDFRVEYAFDEYRVSILNRDGQAVIQNMTATYKVERPNPETTGEEDKTLVEEYDVSDMLPDEARVPDERRHGSGIRFPSPPPVKDEILPFGREVSLEITAGGRIGSYVQRFVGYSNRDFILLYTDFSNQSGKPLALLDLSPVKVDGLKHPWSGTRSALFLPEDPLSLEYPDPNPSDFYQIVESPEGDSVLLVGKMTSSGSLRFSMPSLEPATFFADRGRLGITGWTVSEVFEKPGRTMNPSPPSYEIDVLYFDVNRKPASEAINQFLDLRARFSRVPAGFPFSGTSLEE